MDQDKVVFTAHALKKGKAMGLTEKRLRNLMPDLKRVKMNIFRELHKFIKYGLRQNRVEYYYRKASNRYPSLLYTIAIHDNKYVVLTVTRKRM